jgi:hypothetical protein
MENDGSILAGALADLEVADISGDELDVRHAVTEIRQAAGREIVKNADTPSLGQERVDEVRADETSPTGNENN